MSYNLVLTTLKQPFLISSEYLLGLGPPELPFSQILIYQNVNMHGGITGNTVGEKKKHPRIYILKNTFFFFII